MDRIKLGTRGSPLALKQAEIVRGFILKKQSNLKVEIVIIQTKGDKDKTMPLSEIGGKGIFIKELEHGLLENKIDIAVHSFKDITSRMPDELQLSAFLKPESVADAFLSKKKIKFDNLPSKSSVATSSLRRKVLIKRLRPDLQLVDIRGNIETRIDKLMKGEFEGLLLSEAGLIRLGLQNEITEIFDPEKFIPAPGQGVIAVQTRRCDFSVNELMGSITDGEQHLKSTAELAVMNLVGFDCTIPMGIFSEINGDELYLKGFIANGDGSDFKIHIVSGKIDQANDIGVKMGETLKGHNL